MAPEKSDLRKAATGYMEKTHRPLNCLAFILPLLVAYEIGGLVLGHKVLANQHLSALLERFGATGRLLPAVLLAIVMLAWHVLSKEEWHIDGGTLLGMLVESALLALPLVLLITVIDLFADVPALAAQTDPLAGAGPTERILVTVGAGIYEEFLFRLVGIALVMFLCVDVGHLPKRYAIATAVTVTAVLFSLYHWPALGAYGGKAGWGWDIFVIRALAGGYLALVYVARGFGIAVGAHICFNLFAL